MTLLMAAAPLSAQAPHMRTRHENPPAPLPPPPPKPHGPRAVGVLQWIPDSNGGIVRRLVPVSIFTDGKFYDAGLYLADPLPMALDSGVVYDVEREGESIGLYTITVAQQQKAGWVAAGKWSPSAADRTVLALRERPSTKPAGPVHPVESSNSPKTPEPSSPDSGSNADDRRDRSQTSTTVYDENGRPETPEQADKDTRPTLKRDKADQSARPAPESPAPSTTAQDDSDRPRLHRGVPTQTETAAAEHEPAAPSQPEDAATNDPDRPILRHGRADDRPNSESVPTLPPNAQQVREAVAVSDAVQPNSRDFHYRWSETDRHQADLELATLAQGEIAKYMKSIGAAQILPQAQHPTAAPRGKGRRGVNSARPKQTASASITLGDGELRAFDVFGTNDPVMVYSATAQVNRRTYYATLVTRQDLEGKPRLIFSAVTDDQHLDVFPRLQLIDVVDVDRTRRGALLFRRISADGKDFVIYKVEVNHLAELFHGGDAD